MADQIGLKTIAERLANCAGRRGDRFGYLGASDLLTKLARQGDRHSEWTRH
jgi:hypothetical protein